MTMLRFVPTPRAANQRVSGWVMFQHGPSFANSTECKQGRARHKDPTKHSVIFCAKSSASVEQPCAASPEEFAWRYHNAPQYAARNANAGGVHIDDCRLCHGFCCRLHLAKRSAALPLQGAAATLRALPSFYNFAVHHGQSWYMVLACVNRVMMSRSRSMCMPWCCASHDFGPKCGEHCLAPLALSLHRIYSGKDVLP